MRLAEADVADQDDVGLGRDELQAEEVLDLRPVDFGWPGQLELIEGLEHREAGVLDASLDAAALAHRRFALDQPCQKLHVRELLRGGLCRHGLVMLPDIGQLQAPQLGFE